MNNKNKRTQDTFKKLQWGLVILTLIVLLNIFINYLRGIPVTLYVFLPILGLVIGAEVGLQIAKNRASKKVSGHHSRGSR